MTACKASRKNAADFTPRLNLFPFRTSEPSSLRLLYVHTLHLGLGGSFQRYVKSIHFPGRDVSENLHIITAHPVSNKFLISGKSRSTSSVKIIPWVFTGHGGFLSDHRASSFMDRKNRSPCCAATPAAPPAPTGGNPSLAAIAASPVHCGSARAGHRQA